MTQLTAGVARNLHAARYVIAAGVVAALHVGKLPPSLPVLTQVLGVSLLQAGFLLSMVQVAGMAFGLLTGLATQRIGLKRSMIAGLLLLGCASALGGLAQETAWLLASRALEGIGFLWVVLPGPGLVRQLVSTQRLSRMLGVWSAYMPLGMSLALLCGPLVIYLAAPALGLADLVVVALGAGGRARTPAGLKSARRWGFARSIKSVAKEPEP